MSDFEISPTAHCSCIYIYIYSKVIKMGEIKQNTAEYKIVLVKERRNKLEKNEALL